MFKEKSNKKSKQKRILMTELFPGTVFYGIGPATQHLFLAVNPIFKTESEDGDVNKEVSLIAINLNGEGCYHNGMREEDLLIPESHIIKDCTEFTYYGPYTDEDEEEEEVY